jgi:pimeloyl-ACP methyl ester carboxylesterase/catechol 2,3-dioxygenase-like lactoylglutathione lyase family enzyme
MDMKLEVVVMPVSDVDRAKKFYGNLGWRLDADFPFDNGFRVVQLTPPGSGCSIQFGTKITTAAPGSAQSLYLVVSDIEAARAELVARGAKVSEVFHSATPGGDFQPEGSSGRAGGPAPDHTSYSSYATFSDPDGNSWLLQEVTTRLPGRVDSAATSFGSASDLASALRRAEAAHGQHESEPAADKSAIRPFHVNVPEAELTELRRRINATKWPERETVTDATQGVQLATVQALARYWATEYDWRKIEAKLNALPQFITEIDGLDIHFIHVRSKHENALPLIVTHGWPGSITEQMKIIDPLTNPTAHGGDASDAFHVVIPSMPGYGFSGKPATTGWDPAHIARAWTVLMKRLGYTKFVAQGGDWGAIITELMGVQAPPELLGIHTNMPNVIPLDIDGLAFSGKPAPANLSADEKLAYERLSFVYAKGIGYGFQMGLRPQTLYGIADSPVGLAAYFLDHDARSYELIARVFAGGSEGLTRDDVLDNITLTWLTNTALSGARLYWENKGASFFAVKGVVVPTAVSVFPDELYPAPRSWAERAYPKLIHYNKLDKGGHFAAWEQPNSFQKRFARASDRCGRVLHEEMRHA